MKRAYSLIELTITISIMCIVFAFVMSLSSKLDPAETTPVPTAVEETDWSNVTEVHVYVLPQTDTVQVYVKETTLEDGSILKHLTSSSSSNFVLKVPGHVEVNWH